jgi:predicted dehydrogenase
MSLKDAMRHSQLKVAGQLEDLRLLEMLDSCVTAPQVDLVLIAANDGFHASVATLCAAEPANMSSLTKPIALTLQDTDSFHRCGQGCRWC